MYHTTGFTKAEVTELCARIEARGLYIEVRSGRRSRSSQCAHRYAHLPAEKRPSGTRGELRYFAAHHQPCYLGITPLLVRALPDVSPPRRKNSTPATLYILDGTLLPCWSWAVHRGLYSGKHKTTGKNVQVACTLTGCLAWISDPVDGSRHDTYCMANPESSFRASRGLDWR